MTLAKMLAGLALEGTNPADLACLLAGLLECPVPQLPLLRECELDPDLESRIEQSLARIKAGEPPQYILGKAWFWGLELEVDPRVLIPRPETEGLVEIALELIRPGFHVLEIGTGSGAIAIALKSQMPELDITAVEIGPDALEIARRNASHHSCDIDFVEVDLFPPGDSRFDLIISNPPYISEAEFPDLEPGVRDFEPRQALLAAEQGLEFYRRVLFRAHNYITDKGILLFEHGAEQRHGIIALGESAGFDSFLAADDLAGRHRYLGFRLKQVK